MLIRVNELPNWWNSDVGDQVVQSDETENEKNPRGWIDKKKVDILDDVANEESQNCNKDDGQGGQVARPGHHPLHHVLLQLFMVQHFRSKSDQKQVLVSPDYY